MLLQTNRVQYFRKRIFHFFRQVKGSCCSWSSVAEF